MVIIFDMDVTLFDTESLMIDCWEAVAASYRMAHVEEVCRRCIGINAEKTEEIFLEAYGDRFPLSEMREKVMARFHRSVNARGVPLKPHARELLAFLRRKGYRLALASSTVTVTVEEELKGAKLRAFFEVVVGGDSVKRSKPFPDIFLTACQKLKCRPEEAFIVEDSFNGIRAAHAAKARPIMVPDLIAPTQEIERLCYRVFADLTAVEAFFEQQAGD